MPALRISDIIENASQMPTDEEKVLYLRTHDTKPLRDVLACFYRDDVKFLLPEGEVPYQACPTGEAQGMLYSYTKKFYLFVEGGHPELSKNTFRNNMKRQELFVGMLESIDPKDATLIVAAKDKKMPYKGMTKEIVKKAFPDLIPN